MSNFRIVAKNTVFLTISEVFIKFIGIIWIIYIAHKFSVAEYGNYNLVNSFLAVFSFLPDLGIGLIVIREIAKDRKKADIYLGNSLTLNIVLAFFTIILIVATSYILKYPPEVNFLILIASITLLVSTVRSVGIDFYQGIEDMKTSAVLTFLNSFFMLIFAYFGLALGFGLKGLFIGMLVGSVISLLATWIPLKKIIKLRLLLNWQLCKFLLKEGLPLGLAAFFYIIYTKIDSIILFELLGSRSVGIYNSATPFVFSSIQLLNVPFVVAVYPAISRIISYNDKKRLNAAVKKSLGFILLWSLPWALAISIFSQTLIPLIFGAKYNQAIPILKFLIFFVPFASMSAFLYKVLIALNKQKIYLFVSLIGVLINLILNFIFISRFEIMGAAFASVTTQVLLFTIYLFITVKYIKING